MAQVSHDKIRNKIVRVRSEISNASNDEIVLVLQYYDNDVERTINAFLEDGAREALQQWHYSGGGNKTTGSKKKKKKNKKPNGVVVGGSAPVANGDDAHPVGISPPSAAPAVSVSLANGVCSSGAESVEGTASGASTPAATVVSGGAVAMATPVIDVSAALQKASEEVRAAPAPQPPVKPAPPVGATTAAAKTHVIADHQHTSHASKKGRDRTASENSHHGPTTDSGGAERPAPSVAMATAASAPRKPHAGLEKSVKDLHRQTVSLERLKHVLNENVDKSFKRLHEVFKELHSMLNERESLLESQLNDVKTQANSVLDEQQERARSLKQQSDRAHSDHELAALRHNIKQFVSERKLYEDLSMAQRFTCEVGSIFDSIGALGEVTDVKLPLAAGDHHRPVLPSVVDPDLIRQLSGDTASDISSVPTTPGVVDAPSAPSSTTEMTVAAATVPAATSFHVLTQSDSLTRYEQELSTKQRLTGSNPNVGASERPARTDAGRGGAARGRGSGSRGGQDGRKLGGRGGGGGGGGARTPSSESHRPNYSASRTFVSRNLSSDDRTARKSSSPDLPPPKSAAASAGDAAVATVAAENVVCNGTAESVAHRPSNGSAHASAGNGNGNVRSKNADRSSYGRRGNIGGGSRSNWQQRNGYHQKPANHDVAPAPTLNGKPPADGNSGVGNSSVGNSAAAPVDALPQRTSSRRPVAKQPSSSVTPVVNGYAAISQPPAMAT